MTISSPKSKVEFALKAGMFTLTIVQLVDESLEEVALNLDAKINQAPTFFHLAPVIIDLQRIENDAAFDFQELIKLIKAKKLVPIGVRHANDAFREMALMMGLALFPDEKILSSPKPTKSPELSSTATPQQSADITETKKSLSHTPNRLITQPIRSGQQWYAPNGDLVILTSVSHGAELLADGNIHVYGPLRGRALAGVKGNEEAMIFCKSLEAELISIAGQYRLSEDLKETYWKQAVCIRLKDGRLNIQPV